MNVFEMILNFVVTNWIWIAIAVLAVGILILLWFKNKAIVLMLARRAVMIAEEHLGSQTGQAKKAEAIAWIYVRLPLILKLIFTEKALDNMVEAAVDWLHKQFVDGDLAERLSLNLPVMISGIESIKKEE